MKPSLPIYLLIFVSLTGSGQAQDFYVSPQGNDQWDGSLPLAQHQGGRGPFQSLRQAQAAIRALKGNGQFTQAVTIHIAAGQYPLQQALAFDLRDSGFTDRPIRWQGEGGAVVISGGIELAGCQPGRIWRCPTAGLNLEAIKYPDSDRKRGQIPGFELFVDGQRLPLARWPNSDWAHIRQPLDQRTRFTSIEPLPEIDPRARNLQVHIMAGNDWYDQYLGVRSIENGQISLTAPTGYELTSGHRYRLRNHESLLDAAGEWFYNPQQASLSFMPETAQAPKQVIVSASAGLLQINGANHLSFTGLNLAYCTGNAIEISKSHHVELDHLEIANVGARAVLAHDSSEVSVGNSLIHHSGESGIVVNGGDRVLLRPANHRIYNNHIHHFGETILTYSPAIEMSGVGTQASHNLMEYGGGNAVQFTGNDHLLEKNEIHHVCEQAADCGAIYTGRDWSFHGNVVRYNSVHDLTGYGLKSLDLANNRVVYDSGDGVRGIYLDDAASGIAVHGNLLRHAGKMAIQLGGGRNNELSNNVIVSNGGVAIWLDNRWPSYDWSQNEANLRRVPYLSDVWRQRYPALAEPMLKPTWPEGNLIRHNLIIQEAANATTLLYHLPQYSNRIEQNLLWSPEGHLAVNYNILDHLDQGHADWQPWLALGIEKGSLFADPCLSINANRLKLCPASPASKIGFQALPEDIGLLGKVP